ncbi:unnamed protein product [Spodoptera exigua]|nr:unnamed protein product [Spodoptera exigua]
MSRVCLRGTASYVCLVMSTYTRICSPNTITLFYKREPGRRPFDL